MLCAKLFTRKMQQTLFESRHSSHSMFTDVLLVQGNVQSKSRNTPKKTPQEKNVYHQERQRLPKEHDRGTVAGLDMIWNQWSGKKLDAVNRGIHPHYHQMGRQNQHHHDSHNVNKMWERYTDKKLNHQVTAMELQKKVPHRGYAAAEADISILVYQTASSTTAPPPREDRRRIGVERFYVDQQIGTVQYKTTISGNVHVCIQSKNASPRLPSRADVRVIFPNSPVLLNQQQQSKMALADALAALNGQLEHILNQADFAKNFEVQFHTQSLNLEKATVQYSIFRIICLVLIGTIQMRLIYVFFNKKPWLYS